MNVLSVSPPSISWNATRHSPVGASSSSSIDRNVGPAAPRYIAFSGTTSSSSSGSNNFCCTSSSTPFFSSEFLRSGRRAVSVRQSQPGRRAGRGKSSVVVCGIGDYLGADLLKFDLESWYKDVEDYGSIAVYPPHEGGIEGRYATRLKRAGYHFMNISARGMGDPETYLTRVHGVRPPHLGKQALECFYQPPELDFRLAALPEDAKGIVLWIIEAKVLSKTELQFLAILPALRKKVKVIAECGNWRSFRWKPLRVAAGLPLAEPNGEDEKTGPLLAQPAKIAAKEVDERTKEMTAAVDAKS